MPARVYWRLEFSIDLGLAQTTSSYWPRLYREDIDGEISDTSEVLTRTKGTDTTKEDRKIRKAEKSLGKRT